MNKNECIEMRKVACPHYIPKQYSLISRDISNRILALPVYPALMEDEQSLILGIVIDLLGKG